MIMMMMRRKRHSRRKDKVCVKDCVDRYWGGVDAGRVRGVMMPQMVTRMICSVEMSEGARWVVGERYWEAVTFRLGTRINSIAMSWLRVSNFKRGIPMSTSVHQWSVYPEGLRHY